MLQNFMTLSKSYHVLSKTKLIYHTLTLNLNRFQGIEMTEKGAYNDLPTVGYQGHQSLYRKPVTKIEHRKDPFFNVNPLRPRLKERDIHSAEPFQMLTAGF